MEMKTRLLTSEVVKMKTRLLTSEVVKKIWKSDRSFRDNRYKYGIIRWGNREEFYYIFYKNERGILYMGWTN